MGIVSQFTVRLALRLQVKDHKGAVWALTVKHEYRAEDLDMQGGQNLKLRFRMSASRKLRPNFGANMRWTRKAS
ncbi:hypothetical protein CDN98_23780 [Roseateles terrae]|uniref:Uncharacterized protein n=1 Tax=Roseateles terrae TaxID=431060 RepID=A0ABR6GZ40_9BURK|nr:hypothetical protein [Roseateles terrae]OWQ82918.1 hypothetical protein CDN98_23780 [Roseateles terrae]